MLLSVGVPAAVARFCYSRLDSQNRPLKLVVTALRAVTTLALLLLALDATVIRWQSAGGRLFIFAHPSESRYAERLAQNDRLNDRFQVDPASGTLPELERYLNIYPQERGDSAAIVIATQSAGQAAPFIELLKRRSFAPLFVTVQDPSSVTPDISISSISSDGKAILGASTAVQVTLHGVGMAGKTTRVELSDEVRTLGSASVTWKGEDETAIVQISFSPVVEGLNRLRVIAGPEDGEVTAENNEARFSLDVRRAERRLLFLESQPSWDGKFIRRALQQGGLFKLDYFAQVSREAVLTQAGSGGGGDLRKILASFALLARYDAIIAGPIDSSFFSAREARNINDFIERRGGGLVILGSNNFNGSILSSSSPLVHLSPASVTLARSEVIQSEPERGQEAGADPATFLVPTDEGLAGGLFQSHKPGVVFEKLGPISTSYLKVGLLKPGATALAKDGSAAGPESPALVSGQTYGLGRTILVSPSDLWRAMLAEADENQNLFVTFWQNLAFFATARAEPSSHIRLASPVISAGESVIAYLTVRDDEFNPRAGIAIEAEAEFSSQADEGNIETHPVTVEHVTGAPGVYKLTTTVGEEGSGEVIVRIGPPDGDAQPLRLAFFVQPERGQQMNTPDRLDRLERDVRESGGRAFPAQETERLIAALMDLPLESKQVQSTFRLRESVLMAFLLPVIMAAEYFLRQYFFLSA